MLHIWTWFLTATGSSNTSGVQYGFWSGFGSDLGEIALIGSVITLYKTHNCNVKRCPRIAHHEVGGTTYKTCNKHATEENHDELHALHKLLHPKQHKFLKEK